MRLRCLQTFANQIQVLLWCLDAFGRLLLETVQNVDPLGNLDGIDSRSFFDDPTQCKGFRSLNIDRLYPNGSKKETQSCYCDPRPRRTTSACVSVSVGFTKNRMDVSLNSPGLCHRETRSDPWRNRNLPPIFLPSPCPIALAQLAFCLHALRKASRSGYIF